VAAKRFDRRKGLSRPCIRFGRRGCRRSETADGRLSARANAQKAPRWFGLAFDLHSVKTGNENLG